MSAALHQTETEFQDAVLQAAQALGWKAAHFRPVRVQRANGSVYYETPVAADGKGWPDLVLVRDRVVFAELKAEKGTVRPDQRTWIDRLAGAGAEVYVWRPRDWDEIEAVLGRRKGRA